MRRDGTSSRFLEQQSSNVAAPIFFVPLKIIFTAIWRNCRVSARTALQQMKN